jgi:hypothetical protein
MTYRSTGRKEQVMTSMNRKTALVAAFCMTVFGLLTLSSVAAEAAAPARVSASNGSQCRGAGGVLNNFFSGATGGLHPAILREPEIGAPYLDGTVVRADSSVSFLSWGSCSSQVAFQMQTKICGTFGCHWVTRNHGTWEFLWAHDDTGAVTQQVTMSCRPGTNSYRVEMSVIGLSSEAEEGMGEAPGIVGAAVENETKDGPVVRLSC